MAKRKSILKGQVTTLRITSKIPKRKAVGPPRVAYYGHHTEGLRPMSLQVSTPPPSPLPPRFYLLISVLRQW
jgi:hypothetical protein